MSTLDELAADLMKAAAGAKQIGAEIENSGAITSQLGVRLPGGSGLLGHGAQRNAASTGASVEATANAMVRRAADKGVSLLKGAT